VSGFKVRVRIESVLGIVSVLALVGIESVEPLVSVNLDISNSVNSKSELYRTVKVSDIPGAGNPHFLS